MLYLISCAVLLNSFASMETLLTSSDGLIEKFTMNGSILMDFHYNVGCGNGGNLMVILYRAPWWCGTFYLIVSNTISIECYFWCWTRNWCFIWWFWHDIYDGGVIGGNCSFLAEIHIWEQSATPKIWEEFTYTVENQGVLVYFSKDVKI